MKKWYIVTTVHGKESAVAEAIKLRAENAGNTAISDVLVPKEWRLEYRGKKPRPERVQRVIYPGYVFVEVEVDPEKGVIDPETWSLIRYTLVYGVHFNARSYTHSRAGQRNGKGASKEQRARSCKG